MIEIPHLVKYIECNAFAGYDEMTVRIHEDTILTFERVYPFKSLEILNHYGNVKEGRSDE